MIKVGFIGAGAMGGAIVRGLAALPEYEPLVYERDEERLTRLVADCGAGTAASALDVALACRVVVICVKPAAVEKVVREIAPALGSASCLVSIAAGVGQDKLRSWSGGSCPVVRVMPNTPALVGQGLFALCFDDPGVTGVQKKLLTSMFAALGETFDLPERHFDAFTAVAGSGPAYVYYFMEALTEGALLLGLDRETATRIVKGLFSGSAALAHASPKHLSELREMVTSPAGTTVAALLHLDRQAVRAAIMEAVRKAHHRSRELGEG